MNRTTIVLPPELKFEAQRLAHELHVSLTQLIREALEAQIKKFSKKRDSNPFFEDRQFFQGKAPKDLSENHDDYLY